MGAVFTPLLLSFLLFYTVQGHAGPPAARPPDFETLRKSFSEDEPTMKRIVITKATTEKSVVTTQKAQLTTKSTKGESTTTEESEFANKNFSAEMHEETIEENPAETPKITNEASTTKVPRSSTESIKESTPKFEKESIEPTTEETTTENTTEDETTTEHSTVPALKRIEIKKIVRSTTPLPPLEDRLSPLEELRLLKKISNQGIAFGVKNKELELIHNAGGELELPPFAFSEDENSVAEEGNLPEKVLPTTKKPTIAAKTTLATEATTLEPTTEPSTTQKKTTGKSTTTEATTTEIITEPPSTTEKTTKATTTTTEEPTTTKKITSTTPSIISDIEALEKELDKFKEEPFKIGTNIVPRHLFYDQSMGVHRRRKLANEKKTETKETTTKAPELRKVEISALPPTSLKTTRVTGPTRIPAVMQPFATTSAPRTDDFLVPRPEESDEEKNLDSFSFPMTNSGSAIVNQPVKKSKRPEKMVLPILLKMPHLSSLSTFGSLSVPIHPNGLSQKIHSVRLDSDLNLAAPAKSKTFGKMAPSRKRRRLLRRKIILAAPNKEIEGVTEPVKISPPPFKIVLKRKMVPEEEKKVLSEKKKKTVHDEKKKADPEGKKKPSSVENKIPQKPTSKVVRTNDAAGQEQIFAASLTKKGTTTIELVLDSLKKMKKATRLFLKKAKKGRAKANSGGKTVQASPRLHSHDGSAGPVVKIDGNTDSKAVVVDRDPSRKTVDRDA